MENLYIYIPGPNITFQYTYSNDKIYPLVDKRKYYLCWNYSPELFLYVCKHVYVFFSLLLQTQFQFLKFYFINSCQYIYVLLNSTKTVKLVQKQAEQKLLHNLTTGLFGQLSQRVNGREHNNTYLSCLDYSNSSKINSEYTTDMKSSLSADMVLFFVMSPL